MPVLLGKIEQPHTVFDRYCAGPGEAELFFSFSYQPYYFSEQTETTLFVLCRFDQETPGTAHKHYSSFITADEQLGKRIAANCEASSFLEIVESLDLQILNFSEPLALETIDIPKPWGKEIWYTGIEERGVCTIQGIPLPWISAVYPGLFASDPVLASTELASHESIDEPVLLKILAPQKDEVLGNLYFELHTEKIEVYVITHLDPEAWPTGVAEMRYGFNQDKLRGYETREQFANAYMEAVTDYKSVRDDIDEILESHRESHGFTPEQVLPADIVNTWQNQLPPELRATERKRRARMEAFTGTRKVVVGDVIEVERLMPHSLQHGIRAIEFQSPHYERYILSFAQKVLTQNHWDTEAAMKLAMFEPVSPKNMTTLAAADGVKVEIAADFDSFQVQRLTLEPGAAHTLENITHTLVIGLIGETRLQNKILIPEQAYCLTPDIKEFSFGNDSRTTSKVLIALPKPAGN